MSMHICIYPCYEEYKPAQSTKMEPPSFDMDIWQMRGGNLVLSNETPGMKLATWTSTYLVINIAKFRNFYERTNYEKKTLSV